MRRVPPAILLAMALWLAFALLHAVLLLNASAYYRAYPPWFQFVAGGLRFTTPVLLLAGFLELRQRGAAAGLIAMLVLQVIWLAMPFNMWTKPWPRELMAYGAFAAELVVMGSLATAVWTKRPGLAVCAIATAILVAPPPPLSKLIFGLTGTNYIAVELAELALQLPLVPVLILVSRQLVRDAEPRPLVVGDGLRQSARALCLLSTVAALAGIRAIHQPFWLTAVAAASFAWASYGALRAAQLPLSRWSTTAFATALLWCMSIRLCTLPQLHEHQEVRDPTVVITLMCIAAAAFVTIALSKVVDKMQLQAKGIGAIMMFVTALAIQLFLVPQSQSDRSMIALDVLTGFVVALGAWMLSWLCRLAAEKLESKGELPAARVL